MDFMFLLADAASDVAILQHQLDKLYDLISTMLWAIGSAIGTVSLSAAACIKWGAGLLFSQEEGKDGKPKGVVLKYHGEGIQAISDVSNNIISLSKTIEATSDNHNDNLRTLQSDVNEIRKQLDRIEEAAKQTPEIRRQLDDIERIARTISESAKHA